MSDQLVSRLDGFKPLVNFDRGRPGFVFAAWYLMKRIFFLTSFPWPSPVKLFILKSFGASVGRKIIIKPRVNIHFPWKLSLGDFVWIGERVEIFNFESVRIGSHCCVSQDVFLCAADHDFRDPFFSYRNAPISIGNGVWLQARVFVCPGALVGSESVVTACSLVKGALPENQVCSGSPALPVSCRWRRSLV
jgi:putative colanic acid biosynthesis acetyltransferase WcaF